MANLFRRDFPLTLPQNPIVRRCFEKSKFAEEERIPKLDAAQENLLTFALRAKSWIQGGH
jgi:hypothetical protein